MSQKHFFVCTNTRPPFAKPSCGPKNSPEILFKFRELIEQNGWIGKVRVNGTDCLGPCDMGPTVVVYPDGVWYGNVTVDDVEELLRSHLEDNKPVERLRIG